MEMDRWLSSVSRTAWRCVAAIALLGTVAAGEAAAAEITVQGTEAYDIKRFPIPDPYGQVLDRYVVRLSGKIGSPDAASLGATFKSIRDENVDAEIVLSLNSPGGSFEEAIKIAKVTPGAATLLERGSECLSACAVVFMAGIEQLAESEPVRVRYVEYPATLGFHRPFIEDVRESMPLPDLSGLEDEQIASVIAAQFSDAYEAVNAQIQRLLDNDPGAWSSSLVARMLLMGEGEYLELQTVGDAVDWGINIVNVKPRADRIGDDIRAYYWLCHNSVPVDMARGLGWWMPEYEEDGRIDEADLLYTNGDPADLEDLESGNVGLWLQKDSDAEPGEQAFLVTMEQLNATGCQLKVYRDENAAVVTSPNGEHYFDFDIRSDNLTTYPRDLPLDEVTQ